MCNAEKKVEKQKENLRFEDSLLCGAYGTRTHDLRRDRAAF